MGSSGSDLLGRGHHRLGQPRGVCGLDNPAPGEGHLDLDRTVLQPANGVARRLVLVGAEARQPPVVLVLGRGLAGQPLELDDHAVGRGQPDVLDGTAVDHTQLADLKVAADEVVLVRKDLVEVLGAGCCSVHMMIPDLSGWGRMELLLEVLTHIRA